MEPKKRKMLPNQEKEGPSSPVKFWIWTFYARFLAIFEISPERMERVSDVYTRFFVNTSPGLFLHLFLAEPLFLVQNVFSDREEHISAIRSLVAI